MSCTAGRGSDKLGSLPASTVSGGGSIAFAFEAVVGGGRQSISMAGELTNAAPIQYPPNPPNIVTPPATIHGSQRSIAQG